ncbi:hypothetical protein F5Y07DRAFT_359772 [Xylaria sp. FL0933]|nr:hypothetical protein F5Y07DRAFT_359772 [Xylaria sp. FL0933]
MEWISQRKQLLDADLAEFRFNPGGPCLIQTIWLRRDVFGKVHIMDDEIHNSEQEYVEWLNKLPSCSQEESVVLVLHQRLEARDTRATSLPYREETFRQAFEKLYQHRSVAHAIRRKSTAVFTCRAVAPWKSQPEWGPAVVYNCKSDTESLAACDDIVLSETHFPKKSMLYAVVYGCTQEAREFISGFFKFAKASAFNPLLLPVMFAELERRRLLNKLDTKGGDLRKRIIDMENRLRHDGPRKSAQSSDSEKEKDSSNRNITQRECEAVNLWVEVSSLKNGLESLKTELSSMLESSQKPLENQVTDQDPLDDGGFPERKIQQKLVFDNIQGRLHDMIVEIDSITRRTQSLLQGMSLATQTESNYLTRKDAWATISIAVESKKDSSHMRYISFLGMIFLPGTFFATLFSMGFFNWQPDGSDQMISPWVVVYFGITILTTIATVWRFREWAKKQDLDATHVYAELDNESGPVSFKPVPALVGPQAV